MKKLLKIIFLVFFSIFSFFIILHVLITLTFSSGIKELNSETVNKIPDEKLVDKLYSYVVELTGNSRGHDEEEILNQINRPTKCVYMVELMNYEVENGGFGQYFYNSSGYFAFEVLDCLKEIGALEGYNITKEAIDFVNKDNLNKDDYKEKQISRQLFQYPNNENDQKFDELSNKYYNYVEEIRKLLVKYVRENIHLFD
ncbi:DUF4375 domain-containing protein [Mycoplasmatota bacterium]|nr:DUF4375 domain-containing protein [Mycoplasmatota bacterium]